jgi:hypothetical protein
MAVYTATMVPGQDSVGSMSAAISRAEILVPASKPGLIGEYMPVSEVFQGPSWKGQIEPNLKGSGSTVREMPHEHVGLLPCLSSSCVGQTVAEKHLPSNIPVIFSNADLAEYQVTIGIIGGVTLRHGDTDEICDVVLDNGDVRIGLWSDTQPGLKPWPIWTSYESSARVSSHRSCSVIL